MAGWIVDFLLRPEPVDAQRCVQDQAAVYGIIARMRDFGFQLCSVRIEIIQQNDDRNR